MTQTGGLDILIAWSCFGLLLIALAYFVLHVRHDPIDEAQRGTDDRDRRPGAGGDG
jgi:hypothetical protein